jgi:hypothetical protein
LKAQQLVAQSQYLEVERARDCTNPRSVHSNESTTAIIAEQHIVIGRNISRLEP